MGLNCFYVIFHGDKTLYKTDHSEKIMHAILLLLIKFLLLEKIMVLKFG